MASLRLNAAVTIDLPRPVHTWQRVPPPELDTHADRSTNMRVSERYKLGMTQSQLDFIDVDTWTDVPVFIDPRALLLFDTEWANDSVALVKHFFGVVRGDPPWRAESRGSAADDAPGTQ